MSRLGLLFPLVFLLVACSRSNADAANPALPGFIDRSLPATLDTAEVRNFATVVDARLRLRPDDRFLLAAGDIFEIATGERVQPEIAFDGRAWRVSAAGRDLGSLPEIPTFADGLDFLTRLAETLGAKGVTAADAAAVAGINAQTEDRLGLAESLRARGLALLAIASANGSGDTDATVRTLARVFGYEAEAGAGSPSSADDAAAASRLLPPAILQARSDAQRATELCIEFHGTVDHLASRDVARDFVNGLEPESPVEMDVRNWFAFTVAAQYEGGGTVKPREAMARTTRISGLQRAWLLGRYAVALGPHDRELHQAVLELFPQLDTRPVEMYEAGLLAHRVLNDPVRRARYLRLAAERAPSLADGGTRAWLHALTGDTAGLRKLAESKDASPANRALALRELGRLADADHAYVTRMFETLLAERYDGVYPTFADYINERRDWPVKERAARRWLAQPPEDASPILIAWYASSLADALQQQRRYDEAWKTIEPHVKVWSGSVISRAMSILDRRGKTEEAIALGKQYIERYHGVPSRGDLAQIYWRHGRFAEAAQLFMPGQKLAVKDLRMQLPQTFVDAFRGESPARAAEALDALAAAGVETFLLSDVVTASRQAELNEHVIAMVERLGGRDGWNAGTPHGSAALIHAWLARRAARSADEAAEWLGANVPDSAASQFVSIAYQNGHDELVLAYATPRLDRLKSIEMLAFLAAAMTRARVPAGDPRRTALIEAVRAHGDQPKSLLPVAQYLLGLIDEEAFFRWPYQPQGRAVVAYFVGLEAASRGDYDKALPWLLAAADGEEMNPPRVWAIETLVKWNAAQKSWPEIERSGLL